jgi:hypothetical protein
MFLAKMKIGFAVVLALGLVGAGASGWAYRSSLAAQAPAKEADKSSLQKPEKGKQEQARRLEDVKTLEAALALAERDLIEFEEQAAEKRANFKLRLLEMEEQLRQMERDHQNQREEGSADLKLHSAQLAELQGKLKSVLTNAANPDAASRQIKKDMDDQRDMIEREKKSIQVGENRRTKELVQLRKDIYHWREKLEMEERLQAIKRQRFADAVYATAIDLQRLQGRAHSSEPSDRTLRELIRKVDDLQREVTEMRRELRRSP